MFKRLKTLLLPLAILAATLGVAPTASAVLSETRVGGYRHFDAAPRPAETAQVPESQQASAFSCYDTASECSDAAKSGGGAADEMVTVYRGVHGNHPQFQSAIQGKAAPWGGHADAALHNAGNNQSVFTSWSTDYRTAVDFALQEGPGGVVLKQTVPRSSLITSPDVFKEFEVLRTGPIQGATPIILSP